MKYTAIDAYTIDTEVVFGRPDRSLLFRSVKRGFDLVVCLLLLPIVAFFMVFLLVANRFGNPGALFYTQVRMGRNCAPIEVMKFRSMLAAPAVERGADDPLETARITPLGRLIRRTRIDELPQIVNVLRGEMSLIGPRPDYYPHAEHYARTIPGYRARHAVRPGITGLAQVQLGYVQGIEETRAKVAADLDYVRELGYLQEARIVLSTIGVILRGSGH